MHRFFAATGRFAVRFRWAVVAAWVSATVLAILLLPSLASVMRQSNTDQLPASSPSLSAARLAAPFQDPNQTPVLVVGRDLTIPGAAQPLVTGLRAAIAASALPPDLHAHLAGLAAAQATPARPVKKRSAWAWTCPSCSSWPCCSWCSARCSRRC